MADEDEKQIEDHLLPAERDYFTSRGEKDIPVSPATPSPPPGPAEKAAEPDAGTSGSVPEGGQQPVGTPAEPKEGDDDRKDTKVPLATLLEERKNRKEMEERLRNAELMNARMEERFKMYVDGTRPAPAAPKPPPRPDEDIFGAVTHVTEAVSGINKKITDYEQRLAIEDRAKQLKEWAASHESTFISQNPDYYDALNHLRNARHRELAALGMTEEAGKAQVLAEENQLMAHAAQQRRNPAELAYAIAKTRGYTKKEAPAPANPGKQLDTVEAGQRISGSMSGVGGKAGNSGDVTLADLVKMSDDDFEAFRARNPAKYRRLKGAEH